MIEDRQLIIKQANFRGKAVVYVMSRDQRVQDNHALLAAQSFANSTNSSLFVLFVLKKVPSRSREHYEFMLDGLREVQQLLNKYNIPLIMRNGDAHDEIIKFSSEVETGAIFFDFSPLAYARKLVKAVTNDYDGLVTVVDTHNVIPAWHLSDKQEFAAHTIRRKVHQKLQKYLVSPAELVKQQPPHMSPVSLSFDEANDYIKSIDNCGIKVQVVAGELAAHKLLKNFIKDNLATYALKRNDIAEDFQTGLSPYLHFGQISSLRIALEVLDETKQAPLLFREVKLAEAGESPSQLDGMNALFEEMIVRKELADNFCLYSEDYLSLKAAPTWAQKSLTEHADDQRDFTYSPSQWEAAETHDPIWNVAQVELTKSGKMHGYMRMYWAKKILEWSPSPEEALQTAIYLNDKYSIDGGDPNGYVGILWSIAGLHDRPWFERPVFGKIRYMNDSGLKRKFDVDAYIKRVQAL